jgi:hypothetical protein
VPARKKKFSFLEIRKYNAETERLIRDLEHVRDLEIQRHKDEVEQKCQMRNLIKEAGPLLAAHAGVISPGLAAAIAGTTEKADPRPGEGDAVDHPKHYNSHPSGIEVIRITEHMNFCLGNAVKYILRADHKNDAIEDLRKSRWYIDREIARREAEALKVRRALMYGSNAVYGKHAKPPARVYDLTKGARYRREGERLTYTIVESTDDAVVLRREDGVRAPMGKAEFLNQCGARWTMVTPEADVPRAPKTGRMSGRGARRKRGSS